MPPRSSPRFPDFFPVQTDTVRMGAIIIAMKSQIQIRRRSDFTVEMAGGAAHADPFNAHYM